MLVVIIFGKSSSVPNNKTIDSKQRLIGHYSKCFQTFFKVYAEISLAMSSSFCGFYLQLNRFSQSQTLNLKFYNTLRYLRRMSASYWFFLRESWNASSHLASAIDSAASISFTAALMALKCAFKNRLVHFRSPSSNYLFGKWQHINQFFFISPNVSRSPEEHFLCWRNQSIHISKWILLLQCVYVLREQSTSHEWNWDKITGML